MKPISANEDSVTTEASLSRSTYAEISELAGVSKSTVSRVFNGDSRVHPDRVAAVFEAAQKIGYRPNRAARALSTGRTGLIAVVIDDNVSALGDPFWGMVTSGVSRVLMQNSLQTLLMVAPLEDEDGPVAHYLESNEVDGVIFAQVHKETLVRKVAKSGVPVVVIGTPSDGAAGIHYVDTNNVAGGYMGTNHLFNIGCKTVATITGDVGTSAGLHRLKGFELAHKENNVKLNKNLIAYGNWSFDSAKILMLRLLASNPDIDGVFAANDISAMAAIAAIEERGKRVPDDIAVVGFDDTLVSQTSRPALTTVKQDIVGLGEAAAEAMLEIIAGEKPDSRILSTELIIRQSA
jgi:DNA-binding LacI/PurR family transcriptional regulator